MVCPTSKPDPMTFRVHSVSTTGFEVFVSEPQGDADGFCAFSTFSFAGDWDASITSIKVAPTGEFLGSDGVTMPSFEFDFRVRLN